MEDCKRICKRICERRTRYRTTPPHHATPSLYASICDATPKPVHCADRTPGLQGCLCKYECVASHPDTQTLFFNGGLMKLISDASWVLIQEFMDKHAIDYVALYSLS
ncbi:hypothetical protein HanXRQr2_Chr09g0368801 [Helianthus annuus]|uniref:Uncharacterized protein n=1 Tax=Helianthus annuus TaxID=4232 RepID=A0A9K3I2R6_HELAN|nr:hypothetical protein HanXRQr2_Chr09g0368801 [Helianthus annuus]